MAEPLAFHLPLDAGLHSFNSCDSFGFFSGDFAVEGCGASALKMSFTQGTNGDVARATPPPEYQPRMSLAHQSPAAPDVLEARAETPGPARWSSEQQLNDASLVGYGRPSCGVASTSHDATEVLPLNFGDMDVEQQADALFSKGPLRTLSARTFETLLDESNVRENEEWIALQNLPSLPRDMSAVDLVDDDTAAPPVPPLSPPPTRVAVAAAADEFPAGPAADAEHLDPDTVAYDDALRRAMTARARADEARRFATRKTATATALTMHARRILDAAATAKGGSKSRAGSEIGAGAGSASASKALSEESSEKSGVATPNLSERGGWGVFGGEPDVTSPTRGAKRARSRDGGESTDMEDSDERARVGAGTAKRGRKHRGKLSGVGIKVPQATDQIITADGRSMRRGCLNCGCQKTPQWRMGPDGPKTLCNACGVRFRKGLPMSD